MPPTQPSIHGIYADVRDNSRMHYCANGKWESSYTTEDVTHRRKCDSPEDAFEHLRLLRFHAVLRETAIGTLVDAIYLLQKRGPDIDILLGHYDTATRLDRSILYRLSR